MLNKGNVVLFPNGKKEYMLGFIISATDKFAQVVTVDSEVHTVYIHQCKFIGRYAVRDNP